MFIPKTTIAAIFPGTARQGRYASPKASIERDERLENSSGGAISLLEGVKRN